jgi:hypothetical protein
MNASLLTHYEMPSSVHEDDISNMENLLNAEDINSVYSMLKERIGSA